MVVKGVEIDGNNQKFGGGNCRTANWRTRSQGWTLQDCKSKNWKLTDCKLTDWKLRDWTVEGAIIVCKNETSNVLHHTNVNEYNICNVY